MCIKRKKNKNNNTHTQKKKKEKPPKNQTNETKTDHKLSDTVHKTARGVLRCSGLAGAARPVHVPSQPDPGQDPAARGGGCSGTAPPAAGPAPQLGSQEGHFCCVFIDSRYLLLITQNIFVTISNGCQSAVQLFKL